MNMEDKEKNQATNQYAFFYNYYEHVDFVKKEASKIIQIKIIPTKKTNLQKVFLNRKKTNQKGMKGGHQKSRNQGIGQKRNKSQLMR